MTWICNQQVYPNASHRSCSIFNSSHDEIIVIPAPMLSSFRMEASLMIENVQHPNSNGYMSSEKNDQHNQTEIRPDPKDICIMIQPSIIYSP